MLVAQPLGAAQPDAVDDGGVVELVRQHRVVRTQQHLPAAEHAQGLLPVPGSTWVGGAGRGGVRRGRSHLEQAGVGVEAAGVQDAVLPLVELGQLLLQVLVDVLQTRTRGAELRDSSANRAGGANYGPGPRVRPVQLFNQFFRSNF